MTKKTNKTDEKKDMAFCTRTRRSDNIQRNTKMLVAQTGDLSTYKRNEPASSRFRNVGIFTLVVIGGLP